MENLKIEVEETKTYWQRRRKALVVPIVFIAFQLLVVLPIAYSQANRPTEILVGFIIFCIFFLVIAGLGSSTIYSTFITFIEINENTVHIVYMEKDRKKEITDSMDKFTFKLKNPLGRGVGYFKITYENYSIYQCCLWNWKNENAFFDLWDYLKKSGLLKTPWYY
jgi:hypothetical protein